VSATATTPAVRALEALLELLADAGIDAADDAGAFYPQPIGVLVGLPSYVGRTLGARRYTITVHVVSADPLNSRLARDRAFELADEVALACRINAYRPTSWRGGVNAEPLPAVELIVPINVPEEA
jgi:hypothetical protein